MQMVKGIHLEANSKWHGCSPEPEVKTLQEFIDLVKEDEHLCFWDSI